MVGGDLLHAGPCTTHWILLWPRRALGLCGCEALAGGAEVYGSEILVPSLSAWWCQESSQPAPAPPGSECLSSFLIWDISPVVCGSHGSQDYSIPAVSIRSLISQSPIIWVFPHGIQQLIDACCVKRCWQAKCRVSLRQSCHAPNWTVLWIPQVGTG